MNRLSGRHSWFSRICAVVWIAALIAAPTTALVGVWSGDGRWISTSVVCAVVSGVAFIMGVASERGA